MFSKLFEKVKPWWPLLLTIFFGLVIGRTLFSKSLAVTHDLEIHAARTANYYLALRQGQIPPRWAPNLNYGFGYPVFNFSYHYPYLISAMLFGLTSNIELSLNLFMVFSIILGGLGIYLLSFLKIKKHSQSFIIALSYMTAPYILLNTFVRGALGEIGFWSLLPWVMVFLMLKKNTQKWWYLSLFPIILVCFFLSHQVLVMISLPILLGWILIEEKSLKNKDQKIDGKESVILFLLVAFSILMVMWSWLPMVMEKGLIKTSLPNFMEHSYAEQFPQFSRLFWSKWEYSGLVDRSENGRFTQMIGWVYLVVALIAFIKLLSQKPKAKSYKSLILIYWLVVFVGSVFLMTSASKIVWQIISPLQMLQHPWRLTGFTIISGIMLWLELLSMKKIHFNLVRFINLFTLVSSIWVIIFWARPVATFSKPVEQWLEYHLTGDSYGELQPLWFDSGKNLKDFERLYFVDTLGNMSILNPINLIWQGSNISYDIDPQSDGWVVQKTMYYPGWQVMINDQLVNIDYQTASWSGRVVFPVQKGADQVTVSFSDQKTRRLMADVISLVGLIGWLSLLSYRLWIQMRSRK